MAAFVGVGYAGTQKRRRHPSTCALSVEDNDMRIIYEMHRELLQSVVSSAGKNVRTALDDLNFFTSTMVGGSTSRLPKRQTYPPVQLGDDDSTFVRCGRPSLLVHTKVKQASTDERVARDDDSRDALLLHGLLGSVFSFRKIQQPLADALGGRSVSFDRPGFGLTERPSPSSWTQRGGDVSAYGAQHASTLTVDVMTKYGLRKPALIGHSLGGAVALDVALSGKADVGALVLISPAVRIPRPPQPLVTAMRSFLSTPFVGNFAIRARLERIALDDQIIHFIRRNYHKVERIELAETIAGYRRPMDARDWDKGFLHFSLNFESYDYLTDPRLEQLQAPVLIVAAENDRVLNLQDMREVQRRLPHCDTHIIPDCGHNPHEELPEQTVQLLAEWIASLPPTK